MNILITGGYGMLGSYLREQFEEEGAVTLGRREENDFRADLSKEIPDFKDSDFDLVIHTAGTEEDRQAVDLNLEGTKNLIEGLKGKEPSYFVYISSQQVYSRDAGELVNEESNTWATTEAGKSKALAESFLIDWSRDNKVSLTIIRPAMMFGNGVKGETLRLFNDALTGKYIHIRGNEAKVSLVCALDVARAIKSVYRKGGIYNAADKRPVRFIDMVEAMTANVGAKKRMTHLPSPWAEWIWRLGRWIPSIHRNLAPETVEKRMKTLTLDGSRLADEAGITYHDTLAVIERIEKDYPYTEKVIKKQRNLNEV